LVTCIALLVIARPLLFVSLDPEVATSRGVPIRMLTALFLTLVAITVAESVQAVGALLVFALMVTPAAVAQNLTTSPYAGMALSAAVAVLAVWLGLTLAFYISYPVSFFITALAFGSFIVSLGINRIHRKAATA
jgi:zinc/manganese transport system permease protein